MKKHTATCTLFTLFLLTTIPPINAQTSNTWTLTIINQNGQTTTLTYDQLTAMPSTTVNADLRCYGALVTYGQWTGIKISDLLNAINLNQNIGSIEFHAQDNYKITIPIETAMRDDVIVAYALNSNPIAETLRLVIPDANGNMWISMIDSMTLSTGGAPDPIASVSGFITKPSPDTQNTGSTQQTPTPNPTQKTTPTPAPTTKPTTTPQPTPTQQTQNQINTPNQFIYLTLAITSATAIAFLATLITTKRKKNKLSNRTKMILAP